MDALPRRYSLPLWTRAFGPITLSSHRMRIFPWAAWPPVARLETRILAINRTRPKHDAVKPLPPFPTRIAALNLIVNFNQNSERPRPFELSDEPQF
jgi:hypothetical protein